MNRKSARWLRAAVVTAPILLIGIFHAGPVFASVPVDLSTWLKTRYGDDTELILAVSEPLRWSGDELVTIKFLRHGTLDAGRVVLNASGEEQSDGGVSLRNRDLERRFELVGALSDDLLELALDSEQDKLLPVAIWLRTYEPDTATDDVGNPDTETSNERSRASAVECLGRDWAGLAIPSSFRDFSDAPIATAYLSLDELFSIADSDCIAAIYPIPSAQRSFGTCPASQPPGFFWQSPYRDTTQLNSVSSYNGAGQKVCVQEIGKLDPNLPPTVNGAYSCASTPANQHANVMAGLIRSTYAPYGAAPGAQVYVSSKGGTGSGCGVGPALSYCSGLGAKVWSIAYELLSLGERLVDYWARQSTTPFISVAVGQEEGLGDGSESCPAYYTGFNPPPHNVFNASYNSLIVGGSNDCGTAATSDDWVWLNQADVNPTGGRELPHIVAPAKHVKSINCDVMEGTSNSAPIVAGVAAVVLQAFPTIGAWPEAMRSILMTGALENVYGGPLVLSDAIDDRDGAGEVNAFGAFFPAGNKVNGGNASAIAGWDAGLISSATTPTGTFYSEVYSASHIANGGRLRVVLSWDSTATCTSPSLSSAACASDFIDADLDLLVYDHTNGNLEAWSHSIVDNYEIVEFPTYAGRTYDIKIKAYQWWASSTRFGISWLQGNLGN